MITNTGMMKAPTIINIAMMNITGIAMSFRGMGANHMPIPIPTPDCGTPIRIFQTFIIGMTISAVMGRLVAQAS